MKRTLLLLSLLLISLACGKSEVKPLIGTWHWISTQGGFAGVNETPASTGDERTITFTKKQFTRYLNGEKKAQKMFTIEKGAKTNFGVRDVIKVDGNIEYLYTIEADTLTLSEPYADGFTFRYVKN